VTGSCSTPDRRSQGRMRGATGSSVGSSPAWRAGGPVGRSLRGGRATGCTETKASLRLAKTVPANLNGAAAALRYVREHYDVGRYHVRRGWSPPAAVLYRTCDLRRCRYCRCAPWSVISNDGARSGTSQSNGRRERAACPRSPASATKRRIRHHRFCAADLAAPAPSHVRSEVGRYQPAPGASVTSLAKRAIA
jgi:hypothetical protein